VRAFDTRGVIVKVYAERRRWKLAKEVHVYDLLAANGITQVPRILAAEPDGTAALPQAHAMLTRVDGQPLSAVSADNLPNATPGAYVPKVRPAIGNLMTMFSFGHPDFATLHLPMARIPVIPVSER